jgi:DNA-nicking Smr family endonuclease
LKSTRRSVSPFEGLKEALRKKKKETPARAKDEEEVFREAMEGVREIGKFRRLPLRRPAVQRTFGKGKDAGMEALLDLVEGRAHITLSDTDEYVEWVRPGLRKDTARRLHAGEFSVQDFLDLHGLTAGEAGAELAGFVKDAVRRNLYCVKVIHGRGLRSPGGPVLKKAVLRMLGGPMRKHINAFATARQKDGGLGALYVLLRRRR